MSRLYPRPVRGGEPGRIAFVLSGGGSLGAVQVGMLRALSEHKIHPDFLIGTSVGAVNAAWMAGRPEPGSMDELTEIWLGLRRQDVFPLSPLTSARGLLGRTNHFISNAVARSRPFIRFPHSETLVSRAHDYSFPSDHAVMAGAVAAGLFLVNRRLGVVALAAALLMAVARVYIGAHWPGDVLVVPATGAYGHAMANNYNALPRPPVIFCKGGDARVVVRRERYEDLTARDE